MAAQPSGLDDLDQLARRPPAQLGQGAMNRQLSVEPRGRCLADAEQQTREWFVGHRPGRHGVPLTVPETDPVPGSMLSCATRPSRLPAESLTWAAMFVPCSEVTRPR